LVTTILLLKFVKAQIILYIKSWIQILSMLDPWCYCWSI